jgi:ribosomal protein S18 acetylase RimI-like enzyme
MSSLKLKKMTEAEYAAWAPRSRANYAKDKSHANRLTEAEAAKIAEDDFKRLLPQGLHSVDMLFYTMKLNEEPVGYLWLGVRGPESNRKAYVFDIIVEEAHRERGYGRQAMKFAEEEARRLDLGEIGLHVFGFNRPAIRLYESLGYEVTDLVMAKKLL